MIQSMTSVFLFVTFSKRKTFLESYLLHTKGCKGIYISSICCLRLSRILCFTMYWNICHHFTEYTLYVKVKHSTLKVQPSLTKTEQITTSGVISGPCVTLELFTTYLLTYLLTDRISSTSHLQRTYLLT